MQSADTDLRKKVEELTEFVNQLLDLFNQTVSGEIFFIEEKCAKITKIFHSTAFINPML